MTGNRARHRSAALLGDECVQGADRRSFILIDAYVHDLRSALPRSAHSVRPRTRRRTSSHNSDRRSRPGLISPIAPLSLRTREETNAGLKPGGTRDPLFAKSGAAAADDPQAQPAAEVRLRSTNRLEIAVFYDSLRTSVIW